MPRDNCVWFMLILSQLSMHILHPLGSILILIGSLAFNTGHALSYQMSNSYRLHGKRKVDQVMFEVLDILW